MSLNGAWLEDEVNKLADERNYKAAEEMQTGRSLHRSDDERKITVHKDFWGLQKLINAGDFHLEHKHFFQRGTGKALQVATPAEFPVVLELPPSRMEEQGLQVSVRQATTLLLQLPARRLSHQ